MNKFDIKQRKFKFVLKAKKRSLKFVVAGIILLAVAGFIMYGRLTDSTAVVPEAKPFTYSITQAVDVKNIYLNNSFFDPASSATNTAFLTNLTDKIEAQFKYDFKASEATDLSYQYGARAEIRALFGSDKNSEEGRAKVWSKQYVLKEPVSENRNTASVTLSPIIQIPYAAYYDQMEQFKNAFSAAITSELEVTYTVQLTGNAQGTPINETKTATITVPLDQQIYKIKTKFEKETKNEINSVKTNKLAQAYAGAGIPLAIALAALGLLSVAYGWRKQVIKTPHQRRLERIYRYHDGVIIKTKQPPDLTGKHVVVTSNFDDLLNLEEQLKTPIISSKISDYTTHFFVVWGDIAYVYTLGIAIPFTQALSTEKAPENDSVTL